MLRCSSCLYDKSGTCVNSNTCDNFNLYEPNEAIAPFCSRCFVGKCVTTTGMQYVYDSTAIGLQSTHVVKVGSKYFCAYCGCEAFPIQQKETLAVVGYCCFCDKAQIEREYTQRKKDIEKQYKDTLSRLDKEYKTQLKMCVEKLLELKHKQEHNDLYTEISGVDCNVVIDIDSLI